MRVINRKLGFSLMEVIVIIFIITMGLIGVASLVIQNIQVKDFNCDVLVASQLAQEGLELVRSVRDSNWLASEWFGNGLVAEGGTSIITIYFDGSYIVVNPVVNIDSDEAKLKKNNNFFVHGTGDNTSYSRVIEIDNTDSTGIAISSLVQWNNRGKTHQYRADTILYDWR
jgi:Tfp pilus assembly protein PilV